MGADGLKVVRSARRIPEPERWNEENLDWVKVVPWNLGINGQKADGDIPEVVKSGPSREVTPEELESLRGGEKRKYTDVRIYEEHYDKWGYTHGCPGCSSRIRGLARQAHSKECRERFKVLIETQAFLTNEEEQEAGAKRRNERSEPEEERAKKVRFEDEGMNVDSGGASSSGSGSSNQGGPADVPMAAFVGTAGKIRNVMDLTKMSLDELVERIENREVDVCQVVSQIDGQEVAWDDVNANWELPIEKVKAARAEEMSSMKGKVFKIVKRQESFERTGKRPVSTKWVDTDKSHGQGEMNVRSRWVARDFKTKGERDREDLFCATPPIEMLRFLVSRQATRSKCGRWRKTMFLDVRKAHIIPKCQQDVYVELPPEAGAKEDECGKLEHWLYGCREAGQAWEDHYSKVLIGAGFTRGTSSPVIFHHPQREIWGCAW